MKVLMVAVVESYEEMEKLKQTEKFYDKLLTFIIDNCVCVSGIADLCFHVIISIDVNRNILYGLVSKIRFAITTIPSLFLINPNIRASSINGLSGL